MRWLFTYILTLALPVWLCAQESTKPDSLNEINSIDLNQVVISAPTESDDPAINYYRQNKLPTTEEILGRMSGVSLIRRGNYGMEPVLRSYSGGQINVTINGMKIFGACTGKMDPATIYIEPNNLNNIYVKQGAAGCEWGSTVGGSLNMQTMEASTTPVRKIYLAAASSYSSVNNGYNETFSLCSSGPKTALRLSGTYRKAFNYKEGGGNVVPYSGFEKANYSASAVFRIQKKQALLLDYIGDLGWNIGYPALPMDTKQARANISSISYLFNPERKILKQVETKVYFNHIYHDMDNALRAEIPMRMDMPGWSYTIGAYADMNLDAGERNQLYLRADYYANYTLARMTMYPLNAPVMHMLTLPQNIRHFTGVYASDQWNITQMHILKFNIRGEIMHANLLSEQGKQQWNIFTTKSTTSDKLLPSASLEYSWLCNRQISLNLVTAYGSSAPTANQLYGFYLFNAEDGYDYIGNPSLKSEKSVQAEAKIIYVNSLISTSANGYYHQLYSYIIGNIMNEFAPVTNNALGVKQYRNIRSAFITGAEANLILNLKQGFQSMNTFTYAYGSLSDGMPVPMLSPFRGINSVRYTIKGWHIQAETEWNLAKKRINTNVGETPTPSYALLNLRTGYRLMLKKHVLTLNFSVENVLDKKYRAYSDWGTIIRPDRNFLLYLSYAFSK